MRMEKCLSIEGDYVEKSNATKVASVSKTGYAGYFLNDLRYIMASGSIASEIEGGPQDHKGRTLFSKYKGKGSLRPFI